MRVTIDQLRTLRDIADEIARCGSAEDQIGMPAAYYLKQLDKALPEMASRIRALCATIEAQSNDLEARF